MEMDQGRARPRSQQSGVRDAAEARVWGGGAELGVVCGDGDMQRELRVLRRWAGQDLVTAGLAGS